MRPEEDLVGGAAQRHRDEEHNQHTEEGEFVQWNCKVIVMQEAVLHVNCIKLANDGEATYSDVALVTGPTDRSVMVQKLLANRSFSRHWQYLKKF